MRTVSVTIRRGGLPSEIRGKRLFAMHDCISADVGYYPRVCNDDGTPRLRRNPRTGVLEPYGLPETEKLGDSLFEPMRKEDQQLWFDALGLANPNMSLEELLKKWEDLTDGGKAFNNKHSRKEGYQDFILGVNPGKTPICQENLLTCGAWLIETGNKRNISGEPFTGIWCLDRTASQPTAAELWVHPLRDYFLFPATICRPERSSSARFPRHALAPHGMFSVINFPHTNGLRVPVPLFSARGDKGTIMGLPVRQNWIRDTRVCILDDDEFPVSTV